MARIQLKVGHIAGCGCPVVAVTEDGYTIRHDSGCSLHGDEHVEAYHGQAVCSGDCVVAVLRLDLPYPHQMPGWDEYISSQ